MFVLVMYDVEARRTEKFRKVLARHLLHEQYSVFFGTLTGAQLVALRKALQGLVRPGDRIIEVRAENRNNIRILRHERLSEKGPARTTEDRRHLTESEVL